MQYYKATLLPDTRQFKLTTNNRKNFKNLELNELLNYVPITKSDVTQSSGSS